MELLCPLRFINGGGGVVSGAGLLPALAGTGSPRAAPCVGRRWGAAGRLGLAVAGGGQCQASLGFSTPGGAGAFTRQVPGPLRAAGLLGSVTRADPARVGSCVAVYEITRRRGNLSECRCFPETTANRGGLSTSLRSETQVTVQGTQPGARAR